jgi:hypothetical protein
MYPYVIPFSGAAMATDPSLAAHTVYERRSVEGTAVSWDQAVKILPIDPVLRDAILQIESAFESLLGSLAQRVPHLPSRMRSLLWVLSAAPVLSLLGEPAPNPESVAAGLVSRLPGLEGGERRELLTELCEEAVECAG